MKRAFVLFFLMAFVFQSTSSLWVITSFYIQREYISQNLCVNRFEAISVCKGQCFLTKQINENQCKEQSKSVIKQQEVQLFFQEFKSALLPKLDCFEIFKLFPLKDKSPMRDFIFSIFHPPRF